MTWRSFYKRKRQMNISQEKFRERIEWFATEIHERVCKSGKKKDIDDIQKLTEQMYEELWAMDISIEDKFDNMPHMVVVGLVTNVREASSLMSTAMEEEVKNALMMPVLDDYFGYHFERFKVGVCSFYHIYVEEHEIN